MADVRCYTHYDYPVDKGERNSGESYVDASGYVSTKKRIEALVLAGERLNDYRRQAYDNERNVDDDDWTDPVREPGLDMVDYQRLYDDALSRLTEQARASHEAAVVNTSSTAAEASALQKQGGEPTAAVGDVLATAETANA